LICNYNNFSQVRNTIKPDTARFKISSLLILPHSEQKLLFKPLGIYSHHAIHRFQIPQTKTEARLDVKCALHAWRGNGNIYFAGNNDANNSKNKNTNSQKQKRQVERLDKLLPLPVSLR